MSLFPSSGQFSLCWLEEELTSIFPIPHTLSQIKAFKSPHELKAFAQTLISQKFQEETGLGLALTHRLERLEGKIAPLSNAF